MKTKLSPCLLAILHSIDYRTPLTLQVHSSSEVRQIARDMLLNQVKLVLNQNPQLAQKYTGVDNWDEDFRMKMSGKRHLGHVQRCLFSGDLAMTEFGLAIVNYLKTAQLSDKSYQVLFGSESGDTQMAWTLRPFLMEAGVKFSKILEWIESGRTTGMSWQICLNGFYNIPIEKAFGLPDRFVYYFGEVPVGTPAINLNPNYIAAKAIAGELINQGIFRSDDEI